MTSILITIDTELSAGLHGRGASAEENFAQTILGRVPGGERGIAYQIAEFAAHELKAVFFVEALSAGAVGLDMLKRTIDPILSSGHEVQLHAHTEWLHWLPSDPVDGRRGACMADFSLADQRRVLELGIENLTKAGAPRPIAFRAGNYGANNDTLRALASLGVVYDTSYNFSYLGDPCAILADRHLQAPVRLDGVIEVPITDFIDRPDHFRPAQLCAISKREMQHVIGSAIAQRRQTAVVVSHSFELINRARTRANRIVVDRFRQFCESVGEMSERAKTCGFEGLDPASLTSQRAEPAPLQSGMARTLARMAEQAIGTVIYG